MNSNYRRPKVINLQATDTCNSRCVMCNIWRDGRNDFISLADLKDELSKSFYQEVRHVGVTGGEPTLHKGLVDLYSLLPTSLSNLAGASFITHGLQSNRAVSVYSQTNEIYRALNLSFSGMVSIDGVGEMHDKVRGKVGAFAAASNTLLELRRRSIDVIAACTIVKSNVFGLHNLLAWSKSNNIYTRFRVAEFINRLYNDSCGPEIKSFNAAERKHLIAFFHLLLDGYETNDSVKRTYKSIISILNGGPRLTNCPYSRGEAVNMDSQSSLACCAPKGHSIPAFPEEAETHAALDNQRGEIRNKHCPSCIHDYHDEWAPDCVPSSPVPLRELNYRARSFRERGSVKQNQHAWRSLLLVGWYGTETAGDLAILRALVDEYLSCNPAVSFVLASLHPEYTRANLISWPDSVSQKIVIVPYAKDNLKYSSQVCDAVVMAGGPLMDIAETAYILLAFEMFAELRKPCVIEGCGVGPLNKPDFRWHVTQIARLATSISVRDFASRDLLHRLGIQKNISVRSDPALQFIEGLAKQKLPAKEHVIRCFLRELTTEYPQSITPSQATDNLLVFLRRLLEWYPNHRIELCAMHYFSVGNDDRVFAQSLVDAIASPRITCDWVPRTPEDLFALMDTAEFCICMRFHSCIFAYGSKTRFLAIDYTAGGKIAAFLNDNALLNGVVLADLSHIGKESLEHRLSESESRQSSTSHSLSPSYIDGPSQFALHVGSWTEGDVGLIRAVCENLTSLRVCNLNHIFLNLVPRCSDGAEPSAGRKRLADLLSESSLVVAHHWRDPRCLDLLASTVIPIRLLLWTTEQQMGASFASVPEYFSPLQSQRAEDLCETPLSKLKLRLDWHRFEELAWRALARRKTATSSYVAQLHGHGDLQLTEVACLAINPGARLFIVSHWDNMSCIYASMAASSESEVIREEIKLFSHASSGLLMALRCYAAAFPGDSLLNLWSGLHLLHSGAPSEALQHFQKVFSSAEWFPRLFWYNAMCARQLGRHDLFEIYSKAFSSRVTDFHLKENISPLTNG
jgi:polysaccharide pyruvyl transferase WcaK-like protein